MAARHLNQNDVRSILEAAHHLSINGIQKPSSATRSVSGKHKSNSTLDSPKRISRSGKERCYQLYLDKQKQENKCPLRCASLRGFEFFQMGKEDREGAAFGTFVLLFIFILFQALLMLNMHFGMI